MACSKEETWFRYTVLMGVILQIICLPLEWTYAEYPLRFSKSEYFELLDRTDHYPFIGSEFKGGIITCRSGCNNVFGKERAGWCEISDYLKEACPGCIEQNYSLSLCKLFKNQTIIGVYFLGFGLIFISLQYFYGLISFAAEDTEHKWQNYDKCAKITVACFLIIAFVLIFLSWIIWLTLIASSSIVIGDNCKDFPTDGSIPALCASYGAYLGFVSLIFNIIVNIWFFSSRLREIRSAQAQNINHPVPESAMQIVNEFELNEGDLENKNGEMSVSDLSSITE